MAVPGGLHGAAVQLPALRHHGQRAAQANNGGVAAVASAKLAQVRSAQIDYLSVHVVGGEKKRKTRATPSEPRDATRCQRFGPRAVLLGDAAQRAEGGREPMVMRQRCLG